MAYQSLARKYRPRFFHELVAQDATVLALQNAMRMGREPHGVLFSGIRGVGKTTFARLYAKTLNCLDPRDGGPCDSCVCCTTTSEGRSQDVMEIDGASNTSVDDIRALQETLPYRPQLGKYRIYIIDEVHMLSISAFNALLKSLEEPPAHVVFIFATTEIHKVPATIISRCQVFYLKKIPVPELIKRLKEILAREKIDFDEDAIKLIALEGGGSMRDALTLLDQVIALGAGRIETGFVRSLFSSFSPEELFILLEATVQKDAARIMKQIELFDQSGVRFSKLVEELAKLARHAVICRELGPAELEKSLGVEQGILIACDRLGKSAKILDLNRIFRTLVSCRGDLDGSAIDRYIVENTLLEWCLDPGFEELFKINSGSREKKQASSSEAETIKKEQAQGILTEPRATREVTDAIAADSGTSLEQNQETNQSPVADKNSAVANNNSMVANIAGMRMPLDQRFKEARQVDAKIQEQRVTDEQQLKDGNSPSTDFRTPHPTQQSLVRDNEGSVSVQREDGRLQNIDSPQGIGCQGEPKPKSAEEEEFPPRWEDLISRWKQVHPLKARKLEEIYVIKYSQEEIILGVHEQQFAADTVLSRGFQEQLSREFATMFRFRGKLLVRLLTKTPLPEQTQSNRGEELTPARNGAESLNLVLDHSGQEEPVSESISERKEREKRERKESIERNVRDDKAVQYLLEQFDGKIEKVMISENPS